MADGPAGRSWRAWHVHVPHSRQTAYLRDVVAPLVDDAGLQERFFFLRYWRGGPHLRLRFDGLDDDAGRDVAARLTEALPALEPAELEEYEISLAMQAELAGLEGELVASPRPPNTVEPAPYVPELAKYGGVAGVAIAERLFCATSQVVLATLRTPAGSGTSPPVGEAIRITALALRGSGLDLAASAQFVQRYETFWGRYVPAGQDAAWAAIDERTAGSVLALCRSVWGQSVSGQAEADGTHQHPLLSEYAGALAAAQAHAGRAGTPVDDLAIEGVPYSSCLANYVHTANNRLGLIPAGEALVAHLMRRAIARLERS